ncbi:MAG: hypothetical protein WBL19_00680, partial [Minisyncoccia bacterium]
ISFVGIGVFGFSLFDHSMMGDSTSGCIASAIEGTACPTSIMAMTIHHVSALQTLTTTPAPLISDWSLLLASLLLIGASLIFFYKDLLYPKLGFHRLRLRETALNLSRSRQKITSWLALFELSPALS